jgi:diguanylate cyclase (GGDEF)-like protein
MSPITWLVELGPSAIVLQAVQALLAAAILGLFQRRYASPALAPWTLAWLAEFANFVGLELLEVMAPSTPATRPAMIALAGVTLLAAYLKLGWLLLGTYAIATREPAPRAAVRACFTAALVLATVTTLPAAGDPAGQLARFVLRAGVLALLCGTARMTAGLALIRGHVRGLVGRGLATRGGERPELGRLLVAASLVVMGALSMGAFAVTFGRALMIPRESVPELVPIVPGVGGLNLLLNMTLALGLVIWLLEGEQRRAEHRAYHDALTGLPNRQLLTDRLRHQIASARRTHQPFAVLFIDVDRFKAVNDELGHAAGDRLLQAVAGRLTSALREADTVARLGGDEFIVLATDLTHGSDVVAVADKLRDAMHVPISLDGHDVAVTLSIGASLYPEDATDADSLLRTSDAALYRAKEEGRDRVRMARV